MAFWSGEKIKYLQAQYNLIDPYDPKSIDCAAYTMQIGNEIYISPDSAVASPSRHSKETLKRKEGFAIPPGQFAFLITAEKITVPDTAIAFISIKATAKFQGLVNVSGFHVDPGYKGKLIFSVINAGPRPVHLQEGDPLFLIWYADLDARTEEIRERPGFKNLDAKIINGISGEILSLSGLSKRQDDIEKRSERLDQKVTIMISLSAALIIAVFTQLVGIF